jgi:NodT family efflux transporter outer membrane factor (OMF) lipoprotein
MTMRRLDAFSDLRRALLLGFAITTAACAPTVRLPQPDTRLPTAFEATPANGDAILLDRWWNDFHDPRLETLVNAALERSTTIRLAYARIAEARATRSETRASTLPSGSLSASSTVQGSKSLWGAGTSQDTQISYQATFAPSWEVDLFGRLAAIRNRADLDYQSSALDFYGTRLALAGDVATSLFQARFLATQLADARESLTIASDLARSGAVGLAQGLVSGQDAARLDADAASAEAEVTRLEGELKAAKRSLLILTGDATAPTESLAIEPRLDNPPPLPDLAPGTLLMRRPDVRGAEVALQSAAQTVQIDRLALFPKINIQPGIGLSAMTGIGAAGTALSAIPGIGAGGTGLWSIVAGLAVPVLDRTRLMAALRVSEARGQQAVITYEQTVQTAFGESENALTRVSADSRRIADLDRATTRARAAFDAARRGYVDGLTDLTTLLQVERVWIQNRSALNAARFALLSDTVTAIRALGGGWDPQSSLDSHAPLTAPFPAMPDKP